MWCDAALSPCDIAVRTGGARCTPMRHCGCLRAAAARRHGGRTWPAIGPRLAHIRPAFRPHMTIARHGARRSRRAGATGDAGWPGYC
ncbi:hypothetical protein D7207_03005 [Burkholderia cepacia]|nr:hypothetical protein [Burkholderia cepacia]MBA9942433.1 hypothetical protein [Burkholderia cepacia]MBA9972562.1 hypothetical protein [Burkholderia cepacia]MBA9991134.1 hypothetical protein [Burkholderia cepacia]MBA9999650.1 hypothetical protein [Burkholderia cepacia]